MTLHTLMMATTISKSLILEYQLSDQTLDDNPASQHISGGHEFVKRLKIISTFLHIFDEAER